MIKFQKRHVAHIDIPISFTLAVGAMIGAGWLIVQIAHALR